MIKRFSGIFLVLLLSSCSFLNERHVMVPINSSPSGASIFIDGQYKGQTPAQVKLVPDKNYKATIVKKGYGSSNIDLESWYSVRGGRGGDTTRCVLDAMGVMLVIPAFGFYSVNCRDFKKKEYNVNIGRNDFSSDDRLNLEVIDRNNNSTRSYGGRENPYAPRNNNGYGNQNHQGYGRGY